jgi:hypothetical protein
MNKVGRPKDLINKIVYCLDCEKQLSKNAYYRSDKRCRSCSCKKRLQDPKNNPNFGNKWTKEQKIKQSLSHIGVYKGENHPNWQGGISFEPYSLDWTEELRESIRDRDNHECQICHTRQKDLDRVLTVHHIDYDKENCKSENLISLCLRCHTKTNFNREYWKIYFKNLIKEIITCLIA